GSDTPVAAYRLVSLPSAWTGEGQGEGDPYDCPRYIRVALTLRWTSTSSVRPSLEKIELMCFSTARSVRKRARPMAALFLPWAISETTSRSRAVRASIGEGARERAATSTSTTFG